MSATSTGLASNGGCIRCVRVLAGSYESAHSNMRRAIAGVERATANLDSMIADARPGIQNLTKSTLPEANRLVRDLRQLTQSLQGFTERLEQEGIGGSLGPEKLPDYKPRKR